MAESPVPGAGGEKDSWEMLARDIRFTLRYYGSARERTEWDRRIATLSRSTVEPEGAVLRRLLLARINDPDGEYTGKALVRLSLAHDAWDDDESVTPTKDFRELLNAMVDLLAPAVPSEQGGVK
jgi:hypothetical protein